MSVKSINKEILISSCLDGNIIARFPYDIIDNPDLLKNVLLHLTYKYVDFGLIIKVN